jgi:hypothetical protein
LSANRPPDQGRASLRAIRPVEAGDGGRDRVGRARVVDHVVRASESILTRELGRHDRAHLALVEAAAATDAPHLLVLGAVDDQHAVDQVRGAPALEEQGNDQQAVGAAPRRDALADLGADRRVERGLESCAECVVREGAPAQRAAIQRAVGREDAGPERRRDGAMALAARRRELVRDLVGVGDFDAERAKRRGDRRLAAADAAGEADDQAHRR